MNLPRHKAPRIKPNLMPSERGWDFGKPAPSHTAPLADYLGQHIGDGTIVVEPGCGYSPVMVEAVRQARDRLGRVKVVGMDILDGEDDVGGLQRRVDGEIGEGRFLAVDSDVNGLYDGALEAAREDCRERLGRFLGVSDIDAARIGTLVLSGIAHLINWDKPLDCLLGKVDTGGKVVLAGLPDGTNSRRIGGRDLKDLSGCLEGEGYELLDHVFTGSVVPVVRDLRESFRACIEKAVDAEFAANPGYRKHGLTAPTGEVHGKAQALYYGSLMSRKRGSVVWPAGEGAHVIGGEDVHYDRIHSMRRGARNDWRVHGKYPMPYSVASGDGKEVLAGSHEVFVFRKTERVKPLKEEGPNAFQKFLLRLSGFRGRGRD